ncbi:hypothetical protein WI697_26170 [Tistrella mobilis]|uniref:hypothetical protein n=1 Tax=Tistrella mobilis TaxID=171437 RepID=UPI0031F6E2DB
MAAQISIPPAEISAAQPTYTAVADGVLTQDAIASTDLLVAVGSAAQVAAFSNPAAAGMAGNLQTEALLIALPTSGNATLSYAARSTTTATGWAISELSGLSTQAIQEVVAGTNLMGSSDCGIFGFYSDGASFQVIQLGSDGSWGAPVSLYGNPVTGLGVTYDALGNLYAYAFDATSGDLIMASWDVDSSAWSSFTSTLADAPSDASSAMVVSTAGVWSLALVSSEGGGTIYSGGLGATADNTYTIGALATSPTVQATAVGFAFWQADGNPAFVVAGSDGGVYLVVGTSSQSVTQTQFSATQPLQAAIGQVMTVDGTETMNVYGLAGDGSVWSLHTSATGSWLPWIPINTGISSITGDLNPAAGQTLFMVSDAGQVQVWTFDPVSGNWRSTTLQAATTTLYEATRYHLQFTVYDQNQNLVPGLPVYLAVGATSGSADVTVGGIGYTIQAGASPGTAFTTDTTGRLTVMMMVTSSLAAPEFVLNYGLTTIGSAQPNAAINSYLSGSGTLNPSNPGGALPTFDSAGNTLQGATLGGSPLSPAVQNNATLAGVAATSIRNMATVTPSVSTNSLEARRQGGFAVSLRGDRPAFHSFATNDELQAHLAGIRGAQSLGIFSGIGDFAGDVFSGIEQGVIAIENAVVDVANGILSFTATIGNAINQAIDVVISTVEDVARVLAGIFQAIETAIEDVIQWLKALFDFTDIWATKTVIEAGIQQGLSTMSQLLSKVESGVNTWFKDEEAAVRAAFQNLKATFGAATLSSSSGGLYAPTSQSTVSVGSNLTTGDFSNNAHMNWLHNSVSANPAVSVPSPGSSQTGGVTSAFTSVGAKFESQGSAFSDSQSAFLSNAKQQFTSISSVADLMIVDLLTLVEDLIIDALQLADDLFDDFIDLFQALLSAIEDALMAAIGDDALQALWNWVATMGGQSSDTLCLASLISLLLAFPVTIAWKLVNGASSSPFPTTSPAPWPVPGWPTPSGSGGGQSLEAAQSPSDLIVIASYVNLAVSPARIACMILGPSSPRWVSGISLIGTITQFCLCGSGQTALEMVEAIAADVERYVPLIDLLFSAVSLVAACYYSGGSSGGAGGGAGAGGGGSSRYFSLIRGGLGIWGAISLGLNIKYIIDNSPSEGVDVVRIAWPIPNILNLSTMNWPEGGFASFSVLDTIIVGINSAIYVAVPLISAKDGFD